MSENKTDTLSKKVSVYITAAQLGLVLRNVYLFFLLEATTGLEPVIRVLQTRALPTWLRRRDLSERAKRFELSTFSLARRRSTAELHPHN